MNVRPSGTITFLFTDIEGSAKLWERNPDEMQRALARHDEILREHCEANGGFVFKTIGDAFCVAFSIAHRGLAAAVAAQRSFASETWDGFGALRVRMALHTGPAEMRDNDYFGQALNRVSRILAAAHGGQTLLSHATESLVHDHLAGDMHLRELGAVRLRDLARPENLFQVATADLPSEFPALRSLESVPNNLPIQLTSFIGREREIGEVRRLLSATHLLTLTGPGGAGKTRLSLQVAAEVLDQYPDGVWLVELATIDDPRLVAEAVAAALNVRQESNQPLSATLSDFLRSRRLLLVFDNCEHVIAACAMLSEALLRTCPHLTILASSREPLDIAGEVNWAVPLLDLPANWRALASGPGSVERMLAFEAIRLFAERAALARADFALSPANVLAVAQICASLDGIPLAIELAAARAKVLSTREIADRLDDRFQLLTSGGRTAAPRQKTLRALIDWSHDLLTDPERKLLRRLAVFAKGRTLAAIESVCAEPDIPSGEIVDLLGQLVDKSLLTIERSPELGARYYMLESLWDYARGKLSEAGELDQIRERHLDFYVRFAEDAEPRLAGPEQRHWLAIADEERINLRFAVEASLELEGAAGKGLRIVTAMQRFIEVRGLFQDTRDTFQKLLSRPELAVADAVRARALFAAGRLAWIADDLPAARESVAEALTIYRNLRDPAGVAASLTEIALIAFFSDDPGAPALLSEAVGLAEASQERALLARVLHTRAMFAARTTPGAGYEFAQQSLALYRELGDEWKIGMLLWGLGITALSLGRMEEAAENFTQCLTGGWDLGSHWGMAYPIEAFAALAVLTGEYERAARLLGAAESLRELYGFSPAPADHPALRKILTDAASHLREVESARRSGRSMSAEEARSYALRER